MPERREPKRKPREVELFDYPNADHPKYATESGELFSPEEREMSLEELQKHLRDEGD